VREVAAWQGGAYAYGLEALAAARALGGPMHIRRAADVAARAPFDPYHYRIIYQTFHAIRDVARPLARDAHTAVLPFQYRRLDAARRVVMEACPASTLKRLALPHQRYKQPAGGPLSPVQRRVRHAILRGLAPQVAVDDAVRRRIMRDPGGDALDAVLAARARGTRGAPPTTPRWPGAPVRAGRGTSTTETVLRRAPRLPDR
jgi:hypothetical protein